MTSHTPKAEDDLVARLRDGVCVEQSLTGDGSHLDIPATERLLSEAASHIEELGRENFALAANQCGAGYSDEYGNHRCSFIDRAIAAEQALTSQQHTEPVAGEVEVVAWLTEGAVKGHTVSLYKPFEGGEFNPHRSPPRNPIPEPLVTKASYDALLAAKAKVEDEYLRAWNERDAQRRRAEAAERQRDALRELLADALDEHDTSHGEITDPGDPHWSVRARARALKDEGSAP